MDSKTWQPRLKEEHPMHFTSIPYANSTAIQTIEILHYAHSDQLQLIDGNLNDETLSEWFEKDLSSASAGIQPSPLPVGGFRLLILSYTHLNTGIRTISITPKALSTIHKHIDIERFPDMYASTLNIACLAGPESEAADVLPVFWASLFGFVKVRSQLTMKYDPSSNLVYGLLMMSPTSALPRRITFLVKSGKFDCNHHLNLIVCLSQLFLERIDAFLKMAENDLTDVQDDTGQHDFLNYEEADLSILDYGSTTRSLNQTADNLGVIKEILEVLLSMLEKIREWDTAIKNHIPGAVEIGDSHGTRSTSLFTEKANRWMENKLRYLKDYGSSMLLKAGRKQDLVQLLHQAVYQFGAQKDARVNIELAKSSAIIAIETKRDSTAMKTIAVLTMLFLPGTFIAAVFAMPVLDWDTATPSSLTPVIKPGFKCYWAITVPLTVVVVILWAFSILLPWKMWIPKIRGPFTQPKQVDEDVEMIPVQSLTANVNPST